MAAGIISTKAIQLQFLLNHSSFKKRFNAKTSTIENNPQGKTKNVDGFVDGVRIQCLFEQKGKNYLAMIAYFY